MQVDIFVHGATPCGIMAALAAARAGRTVVLQAPENGIGGMLTGGLGIGDAPVNNHANWAGVTAEFINAVAAISGYNASNFLRWHGAPSAFLSVLTDMIAAEPNITLRLRETIVRVERTEERQENGQWASTVANRGDRIRAVYTDPCTWLSGAPGAGDVYEAKAYIDASYNGGLMAAAGVPFRAGREDADEFREQPYAGVLADGGHTTTQSWDGVDADGDLVKYAGWRPLEAFGQSDRRFMAVGYRNCITNVSGGGNLGFYAPPGYDAADFADDIAMAQANTAISILTREHAYNPIHRTSYNDAQAAVLIEGYDGMTVEQRQNAWLRYASTLNELNAFADKFVTNGSDIRSPLAAEFSLTTSDRRRHEIRRQLAYRELGRLHTFQNHPDVPAVVRNRFAGFGLCADEWQSDYILTQGWPSELYEREGRRLIGQTTISFKDPAYQTTYPDSIAYGMYFMDSKAKSIWARPYGGVEYEGHFAVEPFIDADGDTVRADLYRYVSVPLRAVVPPVGTCDNLATCWGVSATEVAFAAIRLEPFLCAVGEAVGQVAVESVVSGVPMARLSYAPVKARLQGAGLKLSRFEGVSP